MASIEYPVELKDDSGFIYFYDQDCVIEFNHELGDEQVDITVDSFKNLFGAEFSLDAENVTMRSIFLSVKSMLESDSGFLECALEEVDDEYVVTSRGPNDPDATIKRRVA